MFDISKCETLLKELTCKQCSKLLSVLPVYYCSAVGNICGRCISTVGWMVSNGTLDRAVTYETVAKQLIFPCINHTNGCHSKLKIEEVEKHEKTCKADSVTCPFNIELGLTSLKCNWVGTISTAVQHLHKNHRNYEHKGLPCFIMNIYDTHVKISLTTFDKETFLVVTTFIKPTNKFYLAVMCCNVEPINHYYRYRLEIGRYNDYFLVISNQSTEKFCNVREIIDKQEAMITIDVASVLSQLQDTEEVIHCKLSISKKSKEDIADILTTLGVSAHLRNKIKSEPSKSKASSTTKYGGSVTKVQVKTSPRDLLATTSKSTTLPLTPSLSLEAETSLSCKMDNTFLEELECPVCNEYMMPPIYICPTGHSICNQCKEKLEICPSCRIPMHDTRNFTLEKLTAGIKYPCCNTDYGCTVLLNAEQIKIHQMDCNYAYSKCPLKLFTFCDTEKIVDVIGHIREKHPTMYVETNCQYERYIGRKLTTYWVTTHEHEIFVMCCKNNSSKGKVKVNVFHVGMNKSKPKYRFQLEFCDQTCNGLKFIISQPCKEFSQNPRVVLKNSLSIPVDMLQPFITSKSMPMLYFKFCIERL